MSELPEPRPGILDLAPYEPGKSGLPGRAQVMKLSSNEGALGPSPRAVAAYEAVAGTMQRYPDGGAIQLRAALGKMHGLDPDRIVCGAGSDEILYNLARGYAGPGDEVLYSAHGFNIYPIAAHCVGATPIAAPEVDLTADPAALVDLVTDRTRLLYIANPNNPTGTYLAADQVAALRAQLPGQVILVLDAAYAEFVTGNDYEAGAALVEAYPNVVMTRTFSKIYGLGALRLGWAYCPPAIADVLNRLRAPFSVNSAALAAGLAALEDTGFTDRARDHNTTWRDWLTGKLLALGLNVTPSAGNFVLVHFSEALGQDAAAANAFLNDRDIIVRQTGGYGLPNALRITIGTEVETRAVADALAAFVSQHIAGQKE